MAKSSDVQALTKAEEDVMQIIWMHERVLVSDVLDYIEEKLRLKRPPHSTISSIVRILEQKGYLDHKAYGRTHEYFPLISKREYSKYSLKAMLSKYFGGSSKQLVSFLVKEKDLDLASLNELIHELEDAKEKE